MRARGLQGVTYYEFNYQSFLSVSGQCSGAGDAAGSPDALLEEGATPSARHPEDIRTALSEDKEWLEQFSAPNRTA